VLYLAAALDGALKPLCLAVRKAATPLAWDRLVLAYHPTDGCFGPALVQAAHARLRAYVAKAVSEKAAAMVRIVFAGRLGVRASLGLADEPDVDGILVRAGDSALGGAPTHEALAVVEACFTPG